MEKEILEKYDKELKQMNSLTNIADELAKKLVKKGLQYKNFDDSKRCCLWLFLKSFKSFQAINLLASSGFGEDALMLLRSLIESWILLKWIFQQDTEKRVLRWMYSAIKDEREYLQRILNQSTDKYRMKKIAKKWLNQVKKEETKFPQGSKKLPDFHTLADQSGLLEEYNIFYREYCGLLHSSALAAFGNYLKFESNISKWKFTCTPSMNRLDEVFNGALTCFGNIIRIFNSCFKLMPEKGIVI